MMKALEEQREANNNNNNMKQQVDDVAHLPKARQQLLDAYSAPVTRVLDSSSSIISSISSTAAALPIIGNYLPGQKSVGWTGIYPLINLKNKNDFCSTQFPGEIIFHRKFGVPEIQEHHTGTDKQYPFGDFCC